MTSHAPAIEKAMIAPDKTNLAVLLFDMPNELATLNLQNT
jgi:hypothetical protein